MTKRQISEGMKAPQTAGDIMQMLSKALAGVWDGSLEAKRGMALARVATPMLKAIELFHLESLLHDMESSLERAGRRPLGRPEVAPPLTDRQRSRVEKLKYQAYLREREELESRSSEELNFYLRYGYWPEQTDPNADLVPRWERDETGVPDP